jgi:hypothetical protein
MILIEGLSHFLTNFLQNLASCQTSFRIFLLPVIHAALKIILLKVLSNYMKFSDSRGTLAGDTTVGRTLVFL